MPDKSKMWLDGEEKKKIAEGLFKRYQKQRQEKLLIANKVRSELARLKLNLDIIGASFSNHNTTKAGYEKHILEPIRKKIDSLERELKQLSEEVHCFKVAEERSRDWLNRLVR